MSLQAYIKMAEDAVITALAAKREGIDDRTGKGTATERIVERDLLLPYLPDGFSCRKGAVVTTADPDNQSPAIDRIVYTPAAAPPLVAEEAHSIFPIESVAGLVEITMYLDAGKLGEDLRRMAPVKAMRTRRYFVPVPNTKTGMERREVPTISPRSFVIGAPADPGWNPATIANALRQGEVELDTHLHGLYVLGVGYFETIPVEAPTDPPYRIKGWTGPDRLFRFANSFRQAFQRWSPLPPNCSADLDGYVRGDSSVLAE
jgi:hypothetical protein